MNEKIVCKIVIQGQTVAETPEADSARFGGSKVKRFVS